MRNKLLLTGAGLLAALLVTLGCSNNSSNNSGAGQSTGQATSSSATAASTSAGIQAHNNADVWFVRNMIPHHQQAIVLCDIVLGKEGIDPKVADLANRIKAEQGPEMQQMQNWLTEWGNPAMPSETPSMKPGNTSQDPHGGMPGMLSDQEVNDLRGAQGHDASVMFLTQMIAHHQGAIDMAQTEVEEGQYPPAVQLAKTIATRQQQEVDEMKNLLNTL